MKFPWNKYYEVAANRVATLQIFITNKCNLNCKGCFARKMMQDNEEISMDEYKKAVQTAIRKGVKKINLLGGEPLLHSKLREILEFNKEERLKTTIYTNGTSFRGYCPSDFDGVKLRVSIYSYKGDGKSCLSITDDGFEFDANFMVSSKTTVDELIMSANRCELLCNCKVFFISSLRELDNHRQEFFDDTEITMPVIKYKELVHEFLNCYNGNMDIHVSKRGVFESTTLLPYMFCNFANYFIGGKIIQCPYDIVNQKTQNDYQFKSRYCQHNTTCLMSKVIYRPRRAEW